MVFVQSSAADIPLTMRRLEENGWEGARIVLRRDYPCDDGFAPCFRCGCRCYRCLSLPLLSATPWLH